MQAKGREEGRDCSATRGSLVATMVGGSGYHDVRRREEDPLLFLTSPHPIRARYLDPSLPVVGMGFEGDGSQKNVALSNVCNGKVHIFFQQGGNRLLIHTNW